MIPIQIIQGAEDHRGHIIGSWLHSYLESSRLCARIRRGTYFAEQEPRIHRLIDRSIVLVASNPADPWHAYGFVVAEPPGLLHYVYVKPMYRRQKVASRLLKAVGLTEGFEFTHLCDANPSKNVNTEAIRRHYGAEFNPYKADR